MKGFLSRLFLNVEPINRKTYIIRQFAILVAILPVSVITKDPGLIMDLLMYSFMLFASLISLALILLWFSFSNMYRRLKDLEKPAWYIAFLLIPGLGLLLYLYLACAPGKHYKAVTENLFADESTPANADNSAKSERTERLKTSKTFNGITANKAIGIVIVLLLLFNVYHYFRFETDLLDIKSDERAYSSAEQNYKNIPSVSIPSWGSDPKMTQAREILTAASAEVRIAQNNYYNSIDRFRSSNDNWAIINLFGCAILLIIWVATRKGENKMLRAITMILNIAIFLFAAFLFYMGHGSEKKAAIILGILALFNFLSLSNAIGASSWLHQIIQRRKVEEQIKTIEAEARLKELQKKLNEVSR